MSLYSVVYRSQVIHQSSIALSHILAITCPSPWNVCLWDFDGVSHRVSGHVILWHREHIQLSTVVGYLKLVFPYARAEVDRALQMSGPPFQVMQSISGIIEDRAFWIPLKMHWIVWEWFLDTCVDGHWMQRFKSGKYVNLCIIPLPCQN